jgi:peptidoglycan/LPS O-acetylase OafA/YrhL
MFNRGQPSWLKSLAAGNAGFSSDDIVTLEAPTYGDSLVERLGRAPGDHADPVRAARTDKPRSRALDGIRGLMATVVFVNHIIQLQGNDSMIFAAHVAVWVFFALSGCVLTRSWDGRFLHFLGRRFLRLWPLYALCMGAGYWLAGIPPSISQLFWIPATAAPLNVDPPAWSLTIEAWAMLAMPAIVWAGRGPHWRAAFSIMLCLVAAVFANDARLLFGMFFVFGAWASQFELHSTILESRLPQWLGAISFPLYLSHWLVLQYAPGPMAGKIVLAIALAWVLTLTVERWSIAASRRSAGIRPSVAAR